MTSATPDPEPDVVSESESPKITGWDNPSEETELLKLTEVEKRLHVGHMTIWRIINEGGLARINLGTEERPLWRVSVAELRRYVEARTERWVR